MSAGVRVPGSLQTLQALSLPRALLTPPFPAGTGMGRSRSQMLMTYLVQWRGGDGPQSTGVLPQSPDLPEIPFNRPHFPTMLRLQVFPSPL